MIILSRKGKIIFGQRKTRGMAPIDFLSYLLDEI